MRKNIFSFILFLTSSIKCLSQDSIAYNKDFVLNEGLYLSYQDFRLNRPITKQKINTIISKNQLDFFTKLVEEDTIRYVGIDNSLKTINPDQLWGYCQNNIIFIYQDNNFYRIPVFGAISSFIGMVEVINYSSGFNPYTNTPMNSVGYKSLEMRQYLFDFYSGEVSNYSTEKLEKYLKRDDQIYKEYKSLSKKKRKESINKYIRIYNEKHPVYFPKN